MKGTIKTLTDKGYGFIAVEGSKKDIFFHARSLRGITYDELQQGDEVSFEVEEGDKGKSAINIELVQEGGE